MRLMTRKGALAEIFSRALHHDNPGLYLVGYLDLGAVREVTIPEFLRISEDFQVVPASRIIYVKKEGNLLYSRGKSDRGGQTP